MEEPITKREFYLAGERFASLAEAQQYFSHPIFSSQKKSRNLYLVDAYYGSQISRPFFIFLMFTTCFLFFRFLYQLRYGKVVARAMEEGEKEPIQRRLIGMTQAAFWN